MPRFSRSAYPFTLVALVLVWAAYMTVAQKWSLFAEFWPASVTMVFGSFIAGSTPAGGGSVAFPVFTKLLGVATDTARTHALMIQAVGMTMASLFIISRGIPFYRRVVKWACLGGAAGMVGGTFCLHLPDPYPKVLFSSVVLAFGIKFAISHLFLRLPSNPDLPADWGNRNRAHFVLVGLLGGAIASQTGSGIDLICFILMTLSYGLMERRAIPTSVIIMASLSVLGFFLHGFVLRDSAAAAPYWLVSVPIVAMGAPFGAFVVAHLPQRLIIAAILLLVVVETATTVIFVMAGAGGEVWLAGAATLAVTAVWLVVMLRRRVRSDSRELADRDRWASHSKR